MSIATKAGDRGETGLIGGERVSKADLRVEAYGTVDELGASLGFARSICADEDVRALTKEIQRELFAVSGAVVRLAESGGEVPAEVTTYLNRLSDLLWLFGRLLELRAGVDSRLREGEHGGPKWSRAW
jgi:cob(I)alamin adenosyltransferase